MLSFESVEYFCDSYSKSIFSCSNLSGLNLLNTIYKLVLPTGVGTLMQLWKKPVCFYSNLNMLCGSGRGCSLFAALSNKTWIKKYLTDTILKLR